MLFHQNYMKSLMHLQIEFCAAANCHLWKDLNVETYQLIPLVVIFVITMIIVIILVINSRDD